MWTKLNALCAVYLFSCLLAYSQQPISQDTRMETKLLIQSIDLDLQSLQISIDGYKIKIENLKSLIKASQNDLTLSLQDLERQRILLENSEHDLRMTQQKYDELLLTIEDSQKQYKSSLKTIKINKVIIGSLLVSFGCSVVVNLVK